VTKGSEAMNRKLLIIIVVLALVAVFIFQNTEVVEIHFLFWKLAMSRSLMFFLILGAGLISGWFLHAHLGQIRKK
jgi:putative membrane protein